jgi:hypothetical protein
MPVRPTTPRQQPAQQQQQQASAVHSRPPPSPQPMQPMVANSCGVATIFRAWKD